MLILGYVKCANFPSGTFMLLFCIWCYNIGNNIKLANAVDKPSYVNVPSLWNITTSVILVSQGRGTYPTFILGWISSELYEDYEEHKLAIYFYISSNDVDFTLVWSSDLTHPIASIHGATLELTLDGNLAIKDAQSGSYLWSSNTSGRAVDSMHLKDDGNLVLLNRKGDPVWESYRHPSAPTNTLLNVKEVVIGQKLTSSMSPFDSGDYYVEWGIDGLYAYLNFVNPPQQYKFCDYQTYNSTVSAYLEDDYQLSYNFSFLFVDLGGRLNWFRWDQRNQSYSYTIDFTRVNDFSNGDCSPTTCGEYGVCKEKECSCPIAKEGSLNYFKPLNRFNFSLGCDLLTPLSCRGHSKHHGFLELEQVTYFDSTPSLVGLDVESCKRACLDQCSCRAVFFHYYNDPSFGNCTLPSELLTLMDISKKNLSHEVLTFLKVQNNARTKGSPKRRIVIYVSISLIFLVFVTGALCFVFMILKNTPKQNDFSLDILVDTISRFSIESLKLATQNFQTKLGRGGFGSVYEGTLDNETKVAVKCLESCHQGTKEFLAEVNTIGSFRHFNLVRLIGFCDGGVNRLLVYEYMCNGSLDKWIFNHGLRQTLTWNIRQKIIEGVAAGLEYLHEHCKKNVIHFDIKPQNILLDKDFNVKISDFGLAKMVDRDESQVMTVVRGTPGYIAPELINGRVISVKVDVYSLGVVILEIVCGRRNFGSSEEDNLTDLVREKADQDQLSDLIDVWIQDTQQREEAVNMMKIAIWCLQPHFIRPTMPKVMKVLQDLSDSETLNNLSELTIAIENTAGEATNNSSFRPMDSILSGPR